MTSSNCVRSRGVTRSSGSRCFFAAALSFAACAFSARAAASGDLSCFGAGFSALPSSGFLAIDLDSRALGDTDLLAILACANELESDARGLAVLRIGNRHVGQVDGQLLGDDAAFLLRRLLLVALHHVDAAHQHAIVVRPHLDHLAGPALVAAGQHHDLVALPDLGRHHSTSGASEMIFMWFLARSSRGTGPKIRVPTGSICGLISTAALRSKRITEPSERLMSLRTRTTTAFITSPFFTLPRGIASLIDTTMTSPTVA